MSYIVKKKKKKKKKLIHGMDESTKILSFLYLHQSSKFRKLEYDTKDRLY